MERIHRLDIAAVVAVAAFLALCVAVLSRATALLEPDDLAYRASIVALAHGHLTLSTAEYQALAQRLGSIAQWVQLPSGRWISEKNPGYPFFALPFQLLGALRLAPLFYGGLACLGLFFGGRRWLGRLGGAWAVVLYCSSGAALVFAWRATMPTFTDASLVAAGVGALLWTFLATDASARRRTIVGLLAFLAIEGATFIRYTDGVALLVAVAAALLVARRTGIGRVTLALWGASIVAFCGFVAAFDAVVYGGVFKTGYRTGEIVFALGAVVPNLEEMPRHLAWSMPLLVIALGAVVWIGFRFARRRPGARVDAAVGAALLALWFGIYGLYAAYTWTSEVGARGPANAAADVHLIRFYVPALGALALLAAWLVRRLPRWTPVAVLAAIVTLGGVVYPQLAGGPVGHGPGGLRGGPGAPSGRLPGGQPPPGAPSGPPAGQSGIPPGGRSGAPPAGRLG
jgi:hypothetical protein